MPKMKDSGIEWIGQIPEDWKVNKGKYCFAQTNDRGNHKSLVLLSPTQNYGVIPQELYEQLSGFNAVKLNEKTDLNLLKTVHKGAYVISLRSFQGGFEYSEYEGVVSPAYQVFYPTIQVDDRYYKYLFKTQVFIDKMNSYTMSLRDGKNIAFADFGRTYLPIPPVKYQKIVADFLDRKCSEIDSLRADIEAEIENLEEYRKSVITEAVTKGLDKNVEMKDSGVEWIGSIPRDWNTIRIGRLFTMRDERNKKPMEEVQLLSLYTGIGVFPHGEYEERGNKAVTVDGYKIVHKNDIVVNIILAWMGAIGISEYDGVTSPAYDIYVPDTTKVVPHFYHYVFRTQGIAGECYKYGRGIMMMRWRTYSQEFKQISVPFPSYNTQQEIADYLDKKCSEIDTTIREKKEQLTVLDDYKKSLIYEYVTGKKEVPNE